ncbi:MAG TPA: hypothetical protein VKB51_19255 [bacterium]|nr:hypothetical protein [bacterium]
MIERLLHLAALLALALALALTLVVPNVVIFGWGHPLLPGPMHLVTLGAIVSGAYALLNRLWRRLYGDGAPWPPLLWAAAALHVVGVALLVWGFLTLDTGLALVGGHYLVPTGLVLLLVHGAVAVWRRPRGTPRWLVTHLPGLGLFVAMSLGALLVMEARTPRWGLYTPDMILMHLLAAGFLFVLPMLLLPGALADATAVEQPAAPLALLRWYAATATGAGGVLLVALTLDGSAPARFFTIGLALLGALLVWLGLPPGGRWRGVALVPLAGRLATGVLLFYAAMRYARGALPGDPLWLARVGVLLFALGVAVPELLVLLEREEGAHGAMRRQALWLVGTAVLLAGQLWAQPSMVRLGVLIWLAGLLWHATVSFRASDLKA